MRVGRSSCHSGRGRDAGRSDAHHHAASPRRGRLAPRHASALCRQLPPHGRARGAPPTLAGARRARPGPQAAGEGAPKGARPESAVRCVRRLQLAGLHRRARAAAARRGPALLSRERRPDRARPGGHRAHLQAEAAGGGRLHRRVRARGGRLRADAGGADAAAAHAARGRRRDRSASGGARGGLPHAERRRGDALARGAAPLAGGGQQGGGEGLGVARGGRGARGARLGLARSPRLCRGVRGRGGAGQVLGRRARPARAARRGSRPARRAPFHGDL
mmetsp:Transcript_47714/g.153432  ORF Transcript_47714/g.153432 Transcript_47714/m.153432 type:complete len:276 (-) Transcript_47714:198-1025(-)